MDLSGHAVVPELRLDALEQGGMTVVRSVDVMQALLLALRFDLKDYPDKEDR